MNQNYIAPEALDDKVVVACRHCLKSVSDLEGKIKFFQGECPHCGCHPTAFGTPVTAERRRRYSDYIGIRPAVQWYGNPPPAVEVNLNPLDEPVPVPDDIIV